ncbi:MAG: methylglyoxal synthase [Lachnospiraceae bacterium]|nr:methylglyoxal synthase [Lachnospiraceae bacterium]
MNIGLTAHNSKKTLLENFCIAYKGILKKHRLVATEMTGKRVEKATGLPVSKFLPGDMGGDMQLQNEIMSNDIDMLIFFHDTDLTAYSEDYALGEICRLCDMYNIPLATNIATAESLILCLDRGDLEWRM